MYFNFVFCFYVLEIVLVNRYGEMMSRPGSMMMGGGGIGGYMPMSRSTSFLISSWLYFKFKLDILEACCSKSISEVNIKFITVISGQQVELVRDHLQEPVAGDLEKEPVG